MQAISQQFFEGDLYKTPAYQCGKVGGGLMKLLGKIVVHSILQGGPGLPIFSPVIFNYLCKGNVEEMVASVTLQDCSLQMQDLINQVGGLTFIVNILVKHI